MDLRYSCMQSSRKLKKNKRSYSRAKWKNYLFWQFIHDLFDLWFNFFICHFLFIPVSFHSFSFAHYTNDSIRKTWMKIKWRIHLRMGPWSMWSMSAKNNRLNWNRNHEFDLHFVFSYFRDQSVEITYFWLSEEVCFVDLWKESKRKKILSTRHSTMNSICVLLLRILKFKIRIFLTYGSLEYVIYEKNASDNWFYWFEIDYDLYIFKIKVRLLTHGLNMYVLLFCEKG